jgi:ketosteroid isomerase-like protein
MFLLSSAAIAQPDPTEEFKNQTEVWRKAYNSGDANNLRPLYTTDAKYLSAHVQGLEAFGIDQVVANFQKGISGGGHIDSIRIISLEYSGSLAYLLTQYHADNSGQKVSGRNLLVLRKVRNKWLITVHMTVV